MALSKLSLISHLKVLANSYRLQSPQSAYAALRCLSFATPEEAAAERRRRKRRLRMEPPLNALNRNQQQQSPIPKPIQNPNAPKLPEPVSALSGKRLDLHNKILKLIRENDLEEAALYTRHSVYSNCRPTIYTVNAVLRAQLRQSKYSDLLSLHRFITQANIAPNIITHDLIFQTYMDCRKPDTALEHYKQLINDAPFNPSPTTYRILIKGLVDNGRVEKAMELKEEMGIKGFSPDPLVYSYLMLGHVRNSDPDGVFKLHDELKEKLGGFVDDGVVYGNLMKGYFMKGMEKEAMDAYEAAVGENSKVKMGAVAYNYVLEALTRNGKFDEALRLFDRMKREHNPPRYLAVNLGSFNVMADSYCSEEKYKEAIEVFREMGNFRCSPDTLSFNALMDRLCKTGMLVEAEELYGEMDDKGVSPDEYTYTLLMDTCFAESRIDDGSAYFKKMIDSGLRPNLAVYNRLMGQLVDAEKIDDAKSFFDLMVNKLKMDDESYKFIMKTLSEAGRLDEVLKIVDEMLDDESVEFSEGIREFVKEELRKNGRENDLDTLIEEKERLKAEAKAREVEAAEAAKRSARAAVSSLLPSKLFGNKELEETKDSGEKSGVDEAKQAEQVVESRGSQKEETEETTLQGR